MIYSRFKVIVMIVLTAIIQACAGGDPQPRPPAHERQSTFYVNQGVELFNQGCYADALDYFQDAHQRFTAADNLPGVARSLHNIADLYYRLDRMPDALAVYDDAIPVFRALGDGGGLAQTLSNKSAALLALGRVREAKEAMAQADAAATQNEHAALRLKMHALLAIHDNDLGQAETLIVKALAAVTPDDGGVLSSLYYTRGHIAFKDNRVADSIKAFEEALILDRKSRTFFDIARDLAALGRCHADQGDHPQAVNYFKRSAKIFALLQRQDKAAEMVDRLKQSAAKTDIPIDATLHWVAQWLANPATVTLCD